MQKYCIVPKRLEEFFALLSGAKISEEDKNMMKDMSIRHIEIEPKKRTWEILFEVKKILPQSLIEYLGEFFKNKYDLNNVFIYQNIINLQVAIDENWEEILKKSLLKLPFLKEILMDAEKEIKKEQLIILVKGGVAAELINNNRVVFLIQAAIKELTGIWCDVICKALTENYNEISKADDVIYQTIAYKEATQQKQNMGKINKKSADKNKENIEDSDNFYIFGNDVVGIVTPIENVKNENKNVVFCGTVINITGRELKNTNIVLFDIVDMTNGISCKLFLKEKTEYERIMTELTNGIFIKVKGKVTYDNFLNDMAMLVNSVQRAKQNERVDLATVKRVELHAHTQMSEMDAVVSVENLVKTASKWGWPAIAITDHGVVQAFPNAAKCVKENKLKIKVIYGMEGYLANESIEQKRANHIILLAKNMIGLQNLYKLVSLSHIRTFGRNQPRLQKRLISEYREGIIVGSACEAGELIRAIVAKKDDEELLEIASFYDYLEIQPIANNDFLKRKDAFPEIKTDEDLRKINLKVAELAKRLGKLLIATGDVHFLNPEDSIYRAIIMKGKGFQDAEMQPPLFLRTTDEMLEEFSYLGEKEAYEAVVSNPLKIEGMIERINPIPTELYSPMIPGADELIKKMTYDKAHELYGGILPQVVQDRINLEIKPIIEHGFSSLYLIAHKLVKKSNIDGYLVGSRGSVGSSLVATLTEITEVNPLPPHWRCSHCKYSKFIEDGSYSSGFDLPDKDCPICGTPMIKDGHEIPFAVFLGFNGEKVPDIDLNFSGVYQPVAHKYTEELFGKDNVYRAGSITTVADKTAYGYVKKFFEEKDVKKRESYIANIAKGCMGIKRTTGQHPAGIMVVPRDMDIHYFSPIQRPANKMDAETITTHFDYHSINERLVKLDILGHDDPTVIKMLEDLTHRDPKTIPFDDNATLSLFQHTKALGLTSEELGATSGTFGIPEFRTSFTRQMIDDTHPDCFSDLVRISGFSHGTDVWLGNAQELIRGGTTNLKNAISARDDIMVYLIHKGVDPLLSFKTMESVRKGTGINSEAIDVLRAHNVPEWYIESCNKIKYLFPRAHATAYVMMAYRIAFCKVHYPLAFYAAHFSIRADAFDVNIVSAGKEDIKRALDELDAQESLDPKDNERLIVLQIAWEMYLRGYSVGKINIYESEAEKFVIGKKALIPPINSLNGFGNVAAKSIVSARKNGIFSSIADFKKRTNISQTNLEKLLEHGCLKGMSESDQMQLFG